jgi:hypothetical protein
MTKMIVGISKVRVVMAIPVWGNFRVRHILKVNHIEQDDHGKFLTLRTDRELILQLF